MPISARKQPVPAAPPPEEPKAVPYGLRELDAAVSVIAASDLRPRAITAILIDESGSFKDNSQRCDTLTRSTLAQVAAEYPDFVDQIIVSVGYISGGYWPGEYAPVDRVVLPDCKVGGDSPILAAGADCCDLLDREVTRLLDAEIPVVSINLAVITDT